MKLIYTVVAGSRLYGMNHKDSDYDYRAIALDSVKSLIGLEKPMMTKDSKIGEHDSVIYSLKQFVTLALNANPNIIELLFAPKESVMTISEEIEPFLKARNEFLSEKVRASFGGYARSQISLLTRKEFKPVGAKAQTVSYYGWDTKAAAHLYRLCLQGYSLLTSPETYSPKLNQEDLNIVMSIRHGELTKDQVLVLCEFMLQGIDNCKTTLLEEPNRKLIQELLMELNAREVHREYYQYLSCLTST